VKFPGNEDLVVYVWVDAPIGYVSFTEEWCAQNGEDWQSYWKGPSRIIHFIGGDIVYRRMGRKERQRLADILVWE
jgi:methionyl-tRNA synthetase